MQNALKCIKKYKIQLSAVEVAVQEWGESSGSVMIALHGWLDNMASFYPLLTHSDWLAQNNIRLITFDWPGHGHSQHRHPGNAYHLLEYVQDVHDLISALNIKKVILLGHSLGGSIATLFSGTFPEMVERLILIEGLGPLTQSEAEGPEQLAKAIAQRNRHQNRDSQVYDDLQMVIKARLQDTDLEWDNVALLVERNMKPVKTGYVWRSDPRLRLPSAIRLTSGQAQAFIDKLTMPVVLLYGKHGFIKKYPVISEMIATNQHIESVELDGGHHLHMQHPEQVIDAVCQFINTNRSGV